LKIISTTDLDLDLGQSRTMRTCVSRGDAYL